MRFLLSLLLTIPGVILENPEEEMPTPNIITIMEWVGTHYPGTKIQTTNCRKVAGSSTWSQHAWGNGADIFVSKTVGNKMRDQLLAEFGEGIKVLLWQVRDHFDHIHVDTWPTGMGTPPCAGGTLKVKHKDGTAGSVFTDDLGGGDADMASGTRALRLAVAEAQNKGWIDAAGANYWLGKAGNPEDLEWQDFENAWAGWKQAEGQAIKNGTAGVDNQARTEAARAHARLNTLRDTNF